MRWRKLLPVGVLGALAVGYLLARPALAASVPHLAIIEFPVALVLVGGLLWAALRRPRAERPQPAPPWRRHRQVVRALPDPVAAPDADALRAWVAHGEAPAAAADVLARAVTTDPHERERLRAQLEPALAGARSRRKREAILHERLDQGTGV